MSFAASQTACLPPDGLVTFSKKIFLVYYYYFYFFIPLKKCTKLINIYSVEAFLKAMAFPLSKKKFKENLPE